MPDHSRAVIGMDTCKQSESNVLEALKAKQALNSSKHMYQALAWSSCRTAAVDENPQVAVKMCNS